MDPFLPDFDPDPEPELAGLVHGKDDGRGYDLGYDVNDRNSGDQHSDDGEDEEGMTASVLLPGSDIF